VTDESTIGHGESRTRRHAPVWIALAVAVLLPFLAVGGLYPLARHDVQQHKTTFTGWTPYRDVHLNRIRPSRTHGLWFEFEMTNRYGERCVGYWRLRPWRKAEIYQE